MDYRTSIITGLNKVLKDELSAASVYHAMAQTTTDARLAEELSAHGDEEFGHYKLLIEFIYNHSLESEITFGVDTKVINNVQVTKETILSTVQALETKAIEDYKSLALLARDNKDLETEEFFMDLMNDEMGHFDDLAVYTGKNRKLSSVLSTLGKKIKKEGK